MKLATPTQAFRPPQYPARYPTARVSPGQREGNPSSTGKPGAHLSETPPTPMLLFFTRETSGPARRMESLLAHLARKERERLRVSRIDVATSPEWVDRLSVTQVPTLVLLKDRRPV